MAKKFGDYLRTCGISDSTLQRLVDYRLGAPKCSSNDRLIPESLVTEFEDSEGNVVNTAILSLLAGKHVIFEGVKGTGKNTLINMLAYIFGRPVYTYSFNKFTDVDSVVGSNTLKDGSVSFNPHQLTQALEDKDGAWFVGDEINMARGDTLAFLHELLDDRGEIEIPSYGKVSKNRHFRFIGTMNYGYTGTQELNEAFADRFVIIHVEPADLDKLLRAEFPNINVNASIKLNRFYKDLHRLALDGEISSKAVSVRGIKSAVDLIINYDLDWKTSMETCVFNKSFDDYEKQKCKDVMDTLFDSELENCYFSNTPSTGTADVDISEVPTRMGV